VPQDLHLDDPHLELDGDALQMLVQRRVRARAQRADSAVTVDGETLARWAQEELSSVVEELAWAHMLMHGRLLS